MSEPIQFRDLRIGQKFHFDRFTDESGLTCHAGTPGSYLYEKLSARTYACIGYGDVLFAHRNAALLLAQRRLVRTGQGRFIEQAKVNRSGRVGSIKAKVYPAR